MNITRRSALRSWISLATLLALFFTPLLRAQETTAPAEPATPTLEQRIAGLEAYINNADPAGSAVTGLPGPGHNGWIMVCAALVLFMTLPGLALFYGGLVRKKNVLSVLAQCLGLAGLVTILWWAVGYSFVFGSSFQNGFLGGTEFFFLKGVTSAPNTSYLYWVSQNVFAMFQLMFAIITPALILGAIAERIKFMAVLAFMGLWMLVVYFPLAHMIWGSTGFMNGVFNAGAAIKSIDFAGGTVVHMSSGWSALVLCLILGPRLGFGKEKISPHNVVLCMVGTGMLWVGWYGFNAGSAGAADGVASNAFMTTTLAAAIAAFVWGALERYSKGKASVVGLCSGAVAGLVTVTPAAGFVDATGAVICGVLGGALPYFFCTKVKAWLKYDDALDTFGVHGVGGTLGAVLTGFLATPTVNGALNLNLKEVVGATLWIEQLKAIGVTLLISIVGTALIAFAVKAILGLRANQDHEQQGLDLADHGEEGYVH